MTFTLIATVVYAATLSLGVIAAVRRTRFGRWHHVLFLLSCLSALAALVLEFSWWTILPLIFLTALPFTRGGHRDHILIGSAGAIAWIIVLVVQSTSRATQFG